MPDADSKTTVGRIDLGPTEPRNMTQTEQRMIDGALRQSARVIPDLLRVDVVGVPVFVKGQDAYKHLAHINRMLSIAKLALFKIASSYGDGPATAARAIEDMKNA
jgi:alpha-D-ribose 1-methylphosphonate 5-triphosphate synthase subunit PhnL